MTPDAAGVAAGAAELLAAARAAALIAAERAADDSAAERAASAQTSGRVQRSMRWLQPRPKPSARSWMVAARTPRAHPPLPP